MAAFSFGLAILRRTNSRELIGGPAPRAEHLHVLMFPDLERAERIGELPPLT